MDELAKMIAEEVGIPEAQAKQAAEVAIKFMQERLPEPMADRLTDALENPEVLKGAGNILEQGMNLFKK